MQLRDQLQDILDSLGGFGPEVWLSVAFAGLLVAELLLSRAASPQQTRRWLAVLSIGALLVAGCWAVLQPLRGFLFLHLLFLDDQAVFFKVVIILGAVAVVAYEAFGTAEEDLYQPADRLPVEWYSLLTALVLGLFIMTMATNLLAIYLSLELVSICSYLLTALTTSRKAAEGSIKYLLFGAVSSAIMLYGMSLLYGMTGTLDITSTVFGVELAKNGPVVVALASMLTLAGLLFKLSLVPFHIWTPDAYDAAPVPVAAFFSIGPKAAGLLVLMRLVSALPGELQTPLAVIALASITLGNLSALWQTDAKRLLAYSTIAHAGFILVGVVAFNESGFQAATFYVATYLFINLAAFFLIDAFARSTAGSLRIGDFAGLGAGRPLLAVAMTVVMLALTGLPPTVGFTAKLLSFSALLQAYQTTENPWLLVLFGLGVLNAVISLFYYLKIPYLLFFKVSTRRENGPVPSVARQVLIGVLVAPIIILFMKPDWLLRLIANL
ncbi:NADH-quinone oxidoreductase subunit N [Nibrella saemangeumensis]|uniref:NADH-quinone oxidoreductase subunit N n=1 Tax=Nibrella saemangeumensis TaxID=1084526 RepID=A0ABP8N269_9BACT